MTHLILTHRTNPALDKECLSKGRGSMKTTLQWGWLSARDGHSDKHTQGMNQWLIGFAILLLLGAYSAMIQAEPEYHLTGRATAGLLSNYQLVKVGQIVGSINAKVEISFAEVFLDIGTGSVRGTIRRALKFHSSRCGTIIEDITYALTGTFDSTTKQFSATSIESRPYTIITPGDAPEFCKDSSFPSFNFCGNLDDDKTMIAFRLK